MKRRIGLGLFVVLLMLTAVGVILVIADDQPPVGPMNTYSGILRGVNQQARTVVVDGSAVPQQFLVANDAEIVVKDKPRGTLADLNVGDGVQVKYTDDSGNHVAHQISLLSLKAP
jgi:hypothetical protein